MLSNHELPYVGRFACGWLRLATTDPGATHAGSLRPLYRSDAYVSEALRSEDACVYPSRRLRLYRTDACSVSRRRHDFVGTVTIVVEVAEKRNERLHVRGAGEEANAVRGVIEAWAADTHLRCLGCVAAAVLVPAMSGTQLLGAQAAHARRRPHARQVSIISDPEPGWTSSVDNRDEQLADTDPDRVPTP